MKNYIAILINQNRAKSNKELGYFCENEIDASIGAVASACKKFSLCFNSFNNFEQCININLNYYNNLFFKEC